MNFLFGPRGVKVAATAALLLLGGVVAVPFLLTIAGDGQVHLAIAERFAAGQPFQYNPGGELVVASTSPFWTLMLASFFRLSGWLTPLWLKLVVVASWLAAAALLYVASRDLWRFDRWWRFGAVAIWLWHTTIVANALGGLENILSALQLLLLTILSARFRNSLSLAQCAALGFLAGWAGLTRPDGGFFAALLLGILFFGARERLVSEHGGWRRFLLRLAVVGLGALAVLGPWYGYQIGITGKVVTDSAIARLYNGRLGSIVLLPNVLYLHPKPLISLATAFLPLTIGYAILTVSTTTGWWQAAGRRWRFLDQQYPKVSALILVAAGFLFYTFVVGAEAFGRYFLPLFPFLILSGLAGLQLAYRALRRRRRWLATGALVAAGLILVFASSVDYYRRVFQGRFDPEPALNTIYGPANNHYLSFNLPTLLQAPAARAGNSREILTALGLPDASKAKIAVTEVQLRYYVDDRIDVLSLDGRTSGSIVPHIDASTGVPDFAGYFEETRPDFVHVSQWCAVGGFLNELFTSSIQSNLVCEWELRTRPMQIGESFSGQGNEVVLAAPEIVRIIWAASE